MSFKCYETSSTIVTVMFTSRVAHSSLRHD